MSWSIYLYVFYRLLLYCLMCLLTLGEKVIIIIITVRTPVLVYEKL